MASSFTPYPPKGPTAGSSARSVKGVADYLQSHDRMRALLPAVTRLAALQKSCQAALPVLFDACSVVQYEAGQLVLASPNAALASKLKQQLPKLQDVLIRQGWQVNAIRLKVQVGKTLEKSIASKQLTLPGKAISAFADLENALESSPRNAELKAALHTMLMRHHGAK